MRFCWYWDSIEIWTIRTNRSLGKFGYSSLSSMHTNSRRFFFCSTRFFPRNKRVTTRTTNLCRDTLSPMPSPFPCLTLQTVLKIKNTLDEQSLTNGRRLLFLRRVLRLYLLHREKFRALKSTRKPFFTHKTCVFNDRLWTAQQNVNTLFLDFTHTYVVPAGNRITYK